MPPEKHISVPKEELRLALKNRLELSDRARFDDLVKLMEGVASFDFVDLKQRMRANFVPFASGAKGEVYLQRTNSDGPSESELDAKVRWGVGLGAWRGNSAPVMCMLVPLFDPFQHHQRAQPQQPPPPPHPPPPKKPPPRSSSSSATPLTSCAPATTTS